MKRVKIALANVHMAGSDAHHDAHLEVTPHGFALFLAPDAEFPFLDINGSPGELQEVVGALQAGIDAWRASENSVTAAEQIPLPH